MTVPSSKEFKADSFGSFALDSKTQLSSFVAATKGHPNGTIEFNVGLFRRT
jgi:hypothetical protein